jgi:hypothetical protein
MLCLALWNGWEHDDTRYYNEDDVLVGKYAQEPISYLDLLQRLGVRTANREQVAGRVS